MSKKNKSETFPQKWYLVKGRNAVGNTIWPVEVTAYTTKKVCANRTWRKRSSDYAMYFPSWVGAWNFLHGSALEDVEDAEEMLKVRRKRLADIKNMEEPDEEKILPEVTQAVEWITKPTL